MSLFMPYRLFGLKFVSQLPLVACQPTCRKVNFANRLTICTHINVLRRYLYSSTSLHYCEKPTDNHGQRTDEPGYRETFAASSYGAYKAGSAKFWLKNGIYLKCIMWMIDPGFTMKEFLSGAQQAFTVINHCVDTEDYDDLEDVMTSEAIQDLTNLSFTDRQEMLPAIGYTVTVVPELCGLISHDDSNRRWFEIVVSCFYLRQNMEEEFKKSVQKMDSWIDLTAILMKCSGMLNLRFVREYTKGCDDSWRINMLSRVY